MSEKPYVAFISTADGMVVNGIYAVDFDDADEHFENQARNYAAGHLLWVEEFTVDTRAEFETVLNLFGSRR